jgi:hypothetical protein
MERRFVDPATGDLHPESYYHRQNIDLATVIEYLEFDNVFGFDIKIENIERMDVKAPEVFGIFATFCASLVERSFETEDDDEREELQSIAAYVTKVMLGKLGHVRSDH